MNEETKKDYELWKKAVKWPIKGVNVSLLKNNFQWETDKYLLEFWYQGSLFSRIMAQADF